MSPRPKYNVIFMRDDAQVRRFRLGTVWIRVLIWLLALLTLAAGGGLYAGFRYWTANAALVEEKRGLERRLIDAEVQLERLGNVEKILRSHDPNEAQALLQTGAMTDRERPASPTSAANLGELFAYHNLRQAGVENIQARVVNNSVQMRFDLNNLIADTTLSGRVDFLVVSNSGRMEQVSAPEADLVFSIQRFKRVQTTFNLPKGMERGDLFGVRVVITGQDGNPIYSETYPLSRIIS